MQLIASIIATSLMFVSIAVYALAVVASFWLPYLWRVRIARAWAKLALWFLKVCCGLSYEIEGRENIPATASIAMVKHSSAMETLAVLAILPDQTWALKRELMWLPFVGWGLALLKPIAIKRGAGRNAVNQLVQLGTQRLREGVWVIVFPEGTRVPAGETGRYGIGGAALAARAGNLIVPIAHNAGDFWPRRGWLKRRGCVRFVIGKPIDPNGKEPREITVEVKKWIEAKTAEIRSTQ